MSKEAIVIGAGVAGLAASIRLALQGFSVRVFEKNSYPGGKLSDFHQDGYHFDAGPSLFTQPGNIEDLFELAGVKIEDYFHYEQVPIACHYFFANGKKVKAWADPNRFSEEMKQELGEDPQTIARYLKQSKRLYNAVGSLFLKHSLHRPTDFKLSEVVHALGTVRPAYLFQSLHRFNKQQFKTEEATQLFNRYATYNGSNPYKAPAMLSLIPHLEMNEGTFYPKGGMISITKALHQLAIDCGVTFHFNCPVVKILTEGRKTTGVQTAENTYTASLIVSNQDVYFTYKHLLQQEARAQKVLKQERSSSALIFYWGINHSFQELGLHNIFFSSDYQSEFRDIFQGGKLYKDPTVYINITSKMEPGLAPEGKENWFVMVNVPANKGQDWERLKLEAKKSVLKRISQALGTEIDPLIETEAILDPITIESKTMSYMGSLYGTSSNSKLAAFFRHPNFSKQYSNLYFVGGSVHPGGGIPLCLRSAAIMSDIVAKSA